MTSDVILVCLNLRAAPKTCGHTHKQKLLGKTANKWNTSPSAAYPANLCNFLADLVLNAGASFGRGQVNQATTDGGSSSSKGVQLACNNTTDSVVGRGSASFGGDKVGGNKTGGSTVGAVGGSSSSGVAHFTAVVWTKLDGKEFDMEACCNFGSPIKVEWDGKGSRLCGWIWFVFTHEVEAGC